jgi:ribosomal protein S18 acetylase RimI-like enzyme
VADTSGSPIVQRRPALVDERASLRAIHHAAYREVVERQFGRWDPDQQDRYFEADWDDASPEAIEYNGALVGYCAVEDRDTYIHIRELVIDPRSQNLGIGSAILREAMRQAEARGVPVILGTLIENRAGGLYERLGFIEFDRTDTHRLFEWSPTGPGAS